MAMAEPIPVLLRVDKSTINFSGFVVKFCTSFFKAKISLGNQISVGLDHCAAETIEKLLVVSKTVTAGRTALEPTQPTGKHCSKTGHVKKNTKENVFHSLLFAAGLFAVFLARQN